ncbi:MAG TPA: hypothetical protein VNU44_08650 [Bryobacteraceae bacterium]|nr:hypothetical protein [Bryobacteraceae bacterium]
MSVSHKDGEKVASLATGWAEVSREIALAQLTKILDSREFRSSKRCSTFLRYVVEHAADNHVESLKERSLGVEVFGRDPNYDTNQDPVVRSTAGEVRKRLAQYYLEAEHRDEIRISLPPGSYNPEIHPSPERTVIAVVEPRVARSARWPWIAAGGIAVAAAAAILLAPLFRSTDLDRFWTPMVEPSSPVVICVGQPKAYKFRSNTMREVEAWIDKSSKGENPAALASIPFSEIRPVWDHNISLVDAQAMMPLCQLLTRKGKKVEIRGGRVSSLADLRGKPCIFIGAFNNDWTMRLTSDLRFYFEQGPSNDSMVIRDRQDLNRTDWAGSRNWPAPADLASDYAIVSRVFNPTIEQTVVSVAGASGYGTYAGGEFLANEEYFAAALRDAPRDWYRKNMQVVLSVKVISGTPGPPKVLATYFW